MNDRYSPYERLKLDRPAERVLWPGRWRAAECC
jgi:hypothetical protein